MTDKDIRYTISAEDRFSRAFASFRRDVTESRDLVSNFGAIAGRALGVFSLGTVATLGGTALAVRNIAQELDNLNDASDATGSAVDKFAALDKLARQNGESTELVTNSLLKLNKALTDGNADSPINQALQQIGLSGEQLRDLDPAEALQQVAKALMQYGNSGERARIIQVLFGKSTRDVAGFLGDLARASSLGEVAISRQAAEAERFNKQLAQLSVDINEVGRSIVGGMLPALNEMFARLKAGREVFGSFSATVLENLGAEKFEQAGDGVAYYAKQVTLLQRTRDAVASGPGGQGDFGQLRLAQFDKEIERLKKIESFYRKVYAAGALDQGQSDPRELARRGRAQPQLLPLPDTGNGAGGTSRQVTEAERYLEALQKQADGYDRLSTAGKLFADIESGRIQGLTPALRKQLELEAQRVDSASRLQAESEQMVDLQKNLNAEREKELSLSRLILDQEQRKTNEVLALLDDTDVARAQKAQGQIEVLRKMLNEPGVDADRASQILEVLERLKAGSADATGKVRTDFEKLEEAVDGFANNSTDAILDFVEGADVSFGNLFKAFRRDLLRELIEDPIRDSMREVVKIIKDELKELDGPNNPLSQLFDFVKGIFSGDGGASSGVGDLLGSLLGGGGSGYTGRANGGGVSRGSLVRWRENGTEWMVPQENGTVITQAQLRGMQGGSVYAPTTLHVNGDVGPQTVALIRRMLDDRDARLVRSMRHGRLAGA